ncbi:unnamed protein product [Soboliphyme baturini]|uniref:Intraflagellar transport protein 172 homolog n=1 Tax=Soboliphyme baturini TaxID=241478 RepID=A0A183INC1_9BILA|nr:unnamed protein product [Soboliphyme baturini]
MHLSYLKNILPHQESLLPLTCLAWAPNGSRLAVSIVDNSVLLFDGDGSRRDRFSSKPVDPRYGKSSYVITALTFSPDSVKLAVGQSDNILFVYKLGQDWSSKKVICNKFLNQSSVTCCLWPSDQKIIVGLNDGRVRVANVKSNKSSTFYNGKVAVISLKTVFSAHADGTVMKISLEKICTHTCCPQVLLCSRSTVVAAGSDKRVLVYGYDGQVQQQYDFSVDEEEREFSAGAICPIGQSTFVIGSYDRIRVFERDTRKKAWNDVKTIAIKNFYAVTSLAWAFDGTCIAASVSGGVDLFRCNLQTSVISANFESTFIGPSQVLLRNVHNEANFIIRSTLGLEIKIFKLMAKESYVMAQTDRSLILFELETGKSSEVAWKSAGNERFYFDFANACLVYNAGEMSVIEYGRNDILISVTTQRFNPHLVSQVVEFNHESKIDWLELNETGKFLLFRDRKMDVHLYDVKTDQKHLLQHRCGFVQVSELILYFSGFPAVTLWLSSPGSIFTSGITFKCENLFRAGGKTNVVVKDVSGELNYTLDENLIEYATAMEDGDFFR